MVPRYYGDKHIMLESHGRGRLCVVELDTVFFKFTWGIANRMVQKCWTENRTGLVDLLATAPSEKSFQERVDELDLSQALGDKILAELHHGQQPHYTRLRFTYPSECEEKELGTEVLLYRHRFTEEVCNTRLFRQAALSIVQNIYLFQNRKIFFGTVSDTPDRERQEAIMLLGNGDTSVPLAKTFQHLIISRVWNRIIGMSTAATRKTPEFKRLHRIVEKLNTLRNIYMILSSGIVRRLVANVSPVYLQSISHEDALQIGSFGIARAAYRYHHSCGVRFSTYAANWIKKEIQRQALENRLIRVSSNSVERFARASKSGNIGEAAELSVILCDATGSADTDDAPVFQQQVDSNLQPDNLLEGKQTRQLLANIIDRSLDGKSGDIIRRRYGLHPYEKEQSIVEIGREYGVTRSSIYQTQQAAFKKLKKLIVQQTTELLTIS